MDNLKTNMFKYLLTDNDSDDNYSLDSTKEENIKTNIWTEVKNVKTDFKKEKEKDSYFKNNWKSYNNENDNSNKKKKTMLCKNTILNGDCGYSTRCCYAHSLEEQVIEPIRKEAIDLINSTYNLNNYSPELNRDLYKTLQIMTKICDKCLHNNCTGGYNCKHGIRDKKQLICEQDLKYGICDDKICSKIHLCKRGLKPMYNTNYNSKTKYEYNAKSNTNFSGKLITDDFIKLLTTIDTINNENSDNSDDIFPISDDLSSDEDCIKSIFSNNLNI